MFTLQAHSLSSRGKGRSKSSNSSSSSTLTASSSDVSIKRYTNNKDSLNNNNQACNIDSVSDIQVLISLLINVSFIPYFCLFVFGILITLVPWFSFCFFSSCPSCLAKCKQRLLTISNFCNFICQKWPNPKNEKWDERNISDYISRFI